MRQMSHILSSLILIQVIAPDPNRYDGDEADRDEDDVQAEQQAVNDHPDHLPFP